MEKRFYYYLKNWNKKQTINIPEKAKEFIQNCLYYYQGPTTKNVPNFPYNNGILFPYFWWDQGPTFSLDIPCLTISADGIDNQSLPALVKVRYINDDKGGILCPLEYNRHWGEIKNLQTNDIDWCDKIDNCVWRGAPTGIQDYGSLPFQWKNLRMMFCYKYREKYDVGINCNWNRWDVTYLKPSLTVKEMLKYKYQISIPGNDKDSGLNWKLASNSVVLMAKPIIESWLMEGLLEPYFHYVPLKDDYSDLDEIIEWCKNNDTQCQEIVKNANTFMKQFENNDVENKLFAMIKKYYSEMFKFI